MPHVLLVFTLSTTVNVTQDREQHIVLVAKNNDPVFTTATEFVVDEPVLSMVSTDMHKNLQVFRYMRDDPLKLKCMADFHLGAVATKLVGSTPHRCVDNARLCSRLVVVWQISFRQHLSSRRYIRCATLVGTLDGGIGLVMPLPEKDFKRLYTLQMLMTHALPQDCGLNPRGFRSVGKALCRCGRVLRRLTVACAMRWPQAN